MGADVGDASFDVRRVVDAEVGEDPQSVFPVSAGQVEVVEGVVSVGEAVVGAGLVCGLHEVGSMLERLLEVDKCEIGAASGVF